MKRLIFSIVMISFTNSANAHWLSKAAHWFSDVIHKPSITRETNTVKQHIDEVNKINPRDLEERMTYLTGQAMAVCSRQSPVLNADKKCELKKKEINLCIINNQSKFINDTELQNFCGQKYARLLI